MKALNVSVRAFYSKDELEEGKLLFEKFLPDDTELLEEELAPESEGEIFTHPLVKLEAKITKKKNVKSFIEELISKLNPEDLEEVKNTIESRIDDDCNLYLRFEKKSLIEDELVLHTRDAVHVKIKLECYPKSRENALEAASNIFNF